MSDILKRSYSALLAGARAANPAATYSSNGYAGSWRDNLMPGMGSARIETDLRAGAGGELVGTDAKFSAAHSSSALAVNTFGPWRDAPGTLHLGDLSAFTALRFEAVCSTGLQGTPPHLDVLLKGPKALAIESKCTEWMSSKEAKFSPSYDTLHPSHGHSPWFAQISKLRSAPKTFVHLDAAQLVKHALGLLSCFPDQPIILLYLFWEPSNATDFAECLRHRDEIGAFTEQIANCSVKFLAMSYAELWGKWRASHAPAHLSYLLERYSRIA